MPSYQNILVAIDLNDEVEKVLSRALEVQKATQCELTVIYSLPPINTYYAVGLADAFVGVDTESIREQAFKRATEKLQEIGEKNNISSDNLLVVHGYPEDAIQTVAKNKAVDLIIVGSHGKRGIRLLLGSTSNAVIHGTPCDVMTVRT